MKIKTEFLVFFYLGLLVSLGCANLPKREGAALKESAFLEPSGFLKFIDIPVPAGFKILPQQSYSFETSGVRVGVLKYQGSARTDQVVNFYKEQMPMFNWNLVNIVEYGERLMNFDRDNESCIINLVTRGNNVVITISLGPKSQPASKKTKEPIK